MLVDVAAQLLPSSIASTLMSASPAVMLLLAWPLLGQRPRAKAVAGVLLGVVGVAAMLLTGGAPPDPRGVLASLAAMVMSSVGFVLTTRWRGDVDVLALTSWQLLAGELVVVPFALAVEGGPPVLDVTELVAFALLSLVATALAYAASFTGLAHLDAGSVGLIGLLNPVTDVLLGVLVASERLAPLQVLGAVLVLGGIALGQRRVRLPRDDGTARAVRHTRSRVGAPCHGGAMTTHDMKADLHRYLREASDALVWKLDGLAEHDVRRPLTPTGTNLLGLVKHVASVDDGYFGETFGRPSGIELPWFADDAEPNADMWVPADQSRAEVLDLFRRVREHSDATIAALDLDAVGHVPWWPAERDEVTLHRVLVHMTAETHRHAGHADIVRELVDGAVGLRRGNDNIPPVGADYWPAHHERLERAAREADDVTR